MLYTIAVILLIAWLLGVVGTYIARIYEEAKHRPRYLVSGSFGRASNLEGPLGMSQGSQLSTH